jgi:ACS family glucarate transporter-like MFS transporter
MPRLRHSIVLLALLVCMVSYMDRACISVAAPYIQREFQLSHARLGMVFSVFSLAYFLFLTPWGMLADRYGARRLVTLGILSWSAFTTLTAAAWNFVSMLAIRFAFGATEASLMPAVASAFARWVPETERSTAFGAFLSGGRIGGAIAPPVAAWLVWQFGWRWMFIAFSGLGLACAAAWLFWYRDQPAEHPRITQMELEIIARGCSGGLRETGTGIALDRRVVLLLGVAFGYTFMWQFYITWFPTYLIENRAMPLAQAAGYASLPFVFGMVANWLGGILTDALGRRYGSRTGRTVLGFAALLASAALLAAGIAQRDSRLAAVLIALAAGAGDLSLGAVWTSATSIGGPAAGAVSGMMNSASNLGGFLSPMLMGWMLQIWGNWNAVLLAGVAADAIAAFLWLGVNRRGAPKTLAEPLL